MISPFGDYSPVIATNVWVDPSARLIGHVYVAEGASIWPGAVVRADESKITIGVCSAVLDLCLIESPENCPVIIEDEVLISHNACIHGATVKKGALVGIGAIVLDQSVIGEGALVGAGAIVTPKTKVPPGMLILGQPAKPVRELTEAEKQNIKKQIEGLSRKARMYKNM